MGHTTRPTRSALLLALLISSSGCISSLTVSGRASTRGARAGVRVDGDALAGLVGLIEGAAAADAGAGAAARVETSTAPTAPEGGSVTTAAGYDARTSTETISSEWHAGGGVPSEAGGEARGRTEARHRGGVAGAGGGPGVASAPTSRGGARRLSDLGAGGAGGGIETGGNASAGGGAGLGAGRGGIGAGGSASAGGGARTSRRARVGRGHSLGDLVGAGVVVDGLRVSLGDIAALPGAGLGGSIGAGAAGAGRVDLRGAVQASVDLEHAALPEGGGETRMVVRLRGDPDLAPPRGRMRVHLVIDRSDSMEASWEQALAAARALVRSLSAEDLLQIVAYGSGAEEVFATAAVGDGRAAREALSGLRVGGYTNIEAGLELAYGSVAATAPRAGDSVVVILVSDGVPNVGAFGAPAVGRLAAEARRDLGCTTTVVGLGGDFDESVLRALSREGRGGYHVAATAAELEPALVAEVGARDRVAARDLRVRITVPRGIEVGDVVDGNAGASLRGRELTLSLPVLHADEERRIVVGLDVPGGSGSRPVASVHVRFRDEASRQVRAGRAALSVTLGGSRAGAAGAAALAALDAELATTLSAAARAVARNDAPAAAALIDDHCAASQVYVGLPGSAGLEGRLDALERIAAALEFYGPGATDGDRRVVARALGGLSFRIGR